MNTIMFYLYRDASNYKMTNDVVLEGEISDKQIQEIMACLDGYNQNEGCGYFIPSQIGLPEKRFSKITADDHCWFELTIDDFKPTISSNCSMTVEELVSKFKEAASKGWQEDNYLSSMTNPITIDENKKPKIPETGRSR